MLIALFIITAAGLQLLALRGGGFHNHMVRQAAREFERQRFTVAPECPFRMPDGTTDFLDLLAMRDAQLIACEVETTPRNALFNIVRAARLGLPLTVIVPDRRVQRVVAEHARAALGNCPQPPIWILLPDQLPQVLTTYFPLFSSANGVGEKQKTNPKGAQAPCKSNGTTSSALPF